jgi:membrane-bound inhibitor of C-type lysozyme
MKSVPSLATLLMLGACASTPAEDARTVTFTCDRGPPLVVTFGDETASIASPEGPIVLPQQPSGSGFAYGTPQRQLRGKGREVTYTVGRMVPVICTSPG